MTHSIGPTLDHASSAMAETLAGEADARPRDGGGGRLARGAMLGRYIVLDTLGRGGMGIVYAAYDPELDRRVALKLLLPGRGDAAAGLRLQREAQAIARLSHPNVVAVYDVGSLGEQVFIAMELVEGIDLARWLEAAPRSPAERLACFLQAGAGLAAAHAADLVHRDFKPENVLMGDDGRARVVDFGLVRKGKEGSSAAARVSLEELPALPKEVSHRFASHDDDIRLTDAGSMVGTPAYMSPEQFHGLPGDARSDQFSFCVALYEALHGERPFAGDNPMELSHAVCGGELRPPPAKHEVSGRLRRVLLQGLAVDPQARHASMEALLEALRQASTSRRRWWVVAGIAIVGAGVGLGAMATHERPCAHATDRAALVWNPARRATLQQAFTASGPSYADDTWARVDSHIDAQVSKWSALQTEVCEANQDLDPVVAAEDPRQRCLDERLAELGELLLVLDRADAKLVTKAVTLAYGLGAVGECATVDLGGVAPSPSDPALREQVDELRAEIRRIELRAKAGVEGRDPKTLEAVVERAEALAYPPLLAEVRELQADQAADQGDFDTALKLRELAFDTAIASRHDRYALRVAGGLTFLLGVTRREPAEAYRWAHHAEALLTRLGNDDRQRMQLLSNWASVHALAGEDERARELYDEALALARTLDEPLNVATLLNNIGAFHAEQQRLELAQEYLEEAVTRQEDLLGADHPSVLRTRANLGVIAVMGGHYREGREILEAVLPRQEAALGVDHPEVAVTLEGLATVLGREGELEQARAARERVLELRKRAYGPFSRPVLSAEANIQGLLIAQDRDDEAYERAMQTLRGLEGRENVDPRIRIQMLENASFARLDAAPAEALALGKEALELCRATSCGERVELGLIVAIGRAHERLGDRKGALEAFEKVVARPPPPTEPWVRVHARFGQARVTLAHDREAALALARRAIEEVGTSAEPEAETQRVIGELEDWLREHG